MERSAVWSIFRQKLLRRLHHPLEHRIALQVTLLQHGVRPHGGMDRRFGAVARHQDVGAAVDAQVGDHSCRTRVTAASASEAVMFGRARWKGE